MRGRKLSGAVEAEISRHNAGQIDLFQDSLGPSKFFLNPNDSRNSLLHTKAPVEPSQASQSAPWAGLPVQNSTLVSKEHSATNRPKNPDRESIALSVGDRKRKRGYEETLAEDRHLQRLVARSAGGQNEARFSQVPEKSSSTQLSGGISTTSPSHRGSSTTASNHQAEAAGELFAASNQHVATQDLRDLEHQELAKSRRSVFLANVSISAITVKNDRKELLNHLTALSAEANSAASPSSIESLRFRSTAYSNAGLPRKAAFAKRSLMESTSKSTHAYVVFTSEKIAREAVVRLNGSMILGRHLRADSVAHPRPQDHRRCVFVGNLGFVDDDTAMQNTAGDSSKRSSSKSNTADYEEGLWRTFGQCGKVENVRLVRAQTNQVGKGFAYVQFENANDVEKALLYDGRKFAPLIPRKLRVCRAKKARLKTEQSQDVKRMARRVRNGEDRSHTNTHLGRASGLYGRAKAARLRHSKVTSAESKSSNHTFEGQRATSRPMHRKESRRNGRPARAAAFRQRQRQAPSNR